MAAFAYTAINASGVETYGELHAPDTAAAREQLRVRGLLASDLKEVRGGQETSKVLFKKVKPKSLQIFSRQFATMIEAGLNNVSALVILQGHTEEQQLSEVVQEQSAELQGGVRLLQAMSNHP